MSEVAQENLEQTTGPVDAPWIVDEVNTPNGVTYFVNHIWEDANGEPGFAHTDQVCQVCMDYRGTRPRDTAYLLAAAPHLKEACERARDFLSLPHGAYLEKYPDCTFGREDRRVAEMLSIALAKVEGRES